MSDPALKKIRDRSLAAVEYCQRVSRDNRRGVGVVAISIINMHELWQGVGYDVSDRVLTEVAGRIRNAIRVSDRSLQIGDSRFLAVLPNLAHEAQLTMFINKLIDVFQAPILVDSLTVFPNVRLGAAFDDDGSVPALDLLRRSGRAVYQAEKQGRLYLVYQQKCDDANGWEIETALREAMQRGETAVHFQPKIDLATGQPYGCEALVRWDSGDRGAIPPDVFIPIAEQSGLIEAVTRSVINTALQNLCTWKSHGFAINMAVNISPAVLRSPRFVEELTQTLQLWNTRPSELTLEITETVAMEMPQVTYQVLRRARECGYHIAIDDFGTGYSSLAYLSDLPADELKIDKAFVSSMQNEANYQIVAAIIDLAQRFDFSIVAEGVESLKTARELHKLKCNYAQGYYYSPALSGEDFLEYLVSCAANRVAS